MNSIKILLGLCLVFGLYAADNGNGNGNGNADPPAAGGNGKVIHETRDGHASTLAGTTSAITYHNGPVILGTAKIYYIWYGDWSGNSGANNIGGSPYFHINTTYYSVSNSIKSSVSGLAKYGGSTTDSGSQGTSLTDAGVHTVVAYAISSGRLPKDTNGVYFVLTAPNVKETSGFCTQYCGWHTRGTISNADIKYSFVGDPKTLCPSSCAEQTRSSPNGDIGADAMASIIAHELEEAVTDPDLNAWYDSRGAENADKCAWTFGTEFTASNGSLANVKLGTKDYLIQQNWKNSGSGYCAMQ